MPWAAVGAVAASVIGGVIQSGSASDAASAQTQAANSAAQAQIQAAQIASDTELKMFNQETANMSPFLQSGTLALGDLMALTGMTGAPPSTTFVPNASGAGAGGALSPISINPNQPLPHGPVAMPASGAGAIAPASISNIMTNAAPGQTSAGTQQPTMFPGSGIDFSKLSTTDQANLSNIMSASNAAAGGSGAVITPADFATLLGGKQVPQVGGQPLSTIAQAANVGQTPAVATPTAPATAPASAPAASPFGTPTNNLNTILNSPLLRAPTAADFHKSPGFDFQFQQGMQGLENAASVGGGIGGNTLKAAMQYGTGLANQDWWNFYNSFTGNQNRVIGTLSGMANSGQDAAANLGAAGTQTAASIGANTIGAGNAAANGIIGAGNASAAGSIAGGNQISSMFQNIGGNTQLWNKIADLINGGGGGFTANTTATNFSDLGFSSGSGAPF